MKQYKLIIFDVDGTLFDTSEGIISSVKYALVKHNLELPSDFDYSVFIGPPVQNSFKRFFPKLSDNEIKEISLSFRNHYKEKDLFKAKPYDGLYETLDYITDIGILVAVGTYKRQDYAYDICNHFGITKYTNNIHGQDFEGKMSKADILNECLKEAGVDASNALMVGDTNSDAEAAEKDHIDFLEVTFGFGFNKDNHHTYSSYFVNSFEELRVSIDSYASNK